jgi:hypothetical protein
LAQEVYDYKVANNGRQHTYERRTNTNGISGGPHPNNRIHNGADERQAERAVFPHHITIRNCHVYNMPSGGITFLQTDWLTVENNFVYKNSNWDLYASSGINIYQAYDIDDNTDDYKFIFRNNISVNNEHLIMWHLTRNFSDGNGIIIDDNRKTQNNHIATAYRGKTLITNNLVVGNGGSGIHSFQSDNVDIINNTSYLNNVTDTKFSTANMAWGEIFGQNSSNMNIFNNIAVVQPYTRNNMNNATSNILYGYNIFYSGDVGVTRTHPLGNTSGGPGDIVGGSNADPMFNDPSILDFTLKEDSPGRSAGVDEIWASLVGNTEGIRGIFAHVGPILTVAAEEPQQTEAAEEPQQTEAPAGGPADIQTPQEAAPATNTNGSRIWLWVVAGAAAAAVAGGVAGYLIKRKK